MALPLTRSWHDTLSPGLQEKKKEAPLKYSRWLRRSLRRDGSCLTKADTQSSKAPQQASGGAVPAAGLPRGSLDFSRGRRPPRPLGKAGPMLSSSVLPIMLQEGADRVTVTCSPGVLVEKELKKGLFRYYMVIFLF